MNTHISLFPSQPDKLLEREDKAYYQWDGDLDASKCIDALSAFLEGNNINPKVREMLFSDLNRVHKEYVASSIQYYVCIGFEFRGKGRWRRVKVDVSFRGYGTGLYCFRVNSNGLFLERGQSHLMQICREIRGTLFSQYRTSPEGFRLLHNMETKETRWHSVEGHCLSEGIELDFVIPDYVRYKTVG